MVVGSIQLTIQLNHQTLEICWEFALLSWSITFGCLCLRDGLIISSLYEIFNNNFNIPLHCTYVNTKYMYACICSTSKLWRIIKGYWNYKNVQSLLYNIHVNIHKMMLQDNNKYYCHSKHKILQIVKYIHSCIHFMLYSNSTMNLFLTNFTSYCHCYDRGEFCAF